MRKAKLLAATAVLTAVTGCNAVGESTDLGVYQLVRARDTAVGNKSMIVTPSRPWNRQRRLFFDSVRWVED